MVFLRKKTTAESSGASIDSASSTLDKSDTASSEHSHHNHHSHSHHAHGRSLPKDTADDPIEFCQEAVFHLFSYPSAKKAVPLDVLMSEFLPRFYSKDYVHRVNNRVETLSDFQNLLQFMRSKWHSVRVVFKSTCMDMDGSSTMQLGTVALHYLLVIEKGDMKEERKTDCFSIMRLKDGKIVTADVCINTEIFKRGDTDLACCIS